MDGALSSTAKHKPAQDCCGAAQLAALAELNASMRSVFDAVQDRFDRIEDQLDRLAAEIEAVGYRR